VKLIILFLRYKKKFGKKLKAFEKKKFFEKKFEKKNFENF
jgi:hypothetical protein